MVSMHCLTSALVLSNMVGATKVFPQVYRHLQDASTTTVVVHFKATSHALRRLDVANLSRSDRINRVVNTLVEHATSSQASLDSLLSHPGLESTSTSPPVSSQLNWIDNSRVLFNASKTLIDQIAALPQVESVRPALRFDTSPSAPTSTSSTPPLWNVDMVHAPQVWATGNKGQGVVVGSIDTGVLHTHESLASNWRQDHGWFDAIDKTPSPADEDGHGTHTVGTMVGTTQGIGVAPSAQWIACRTAKTRSGWYDYHVVACAQFMLCPTDASGNNRDCSKAPHVINNSWGWSNQGETFFDASIAAWRAAGIIPVVSNMNWGPGCNTLGYPATSASVISVGNVDSTGLAAYSSSRGPTLDGRIKPDMAAPGTDIKSASPFGNDAYAWMTGTSMAAPHVSGSIALYLSANKGATYDQVYQALTQSVNNPVLKPQSQTCGAIPDTTFPNNQFGFGFLDAQKLTQTTPPSKCGQLEDNTDYFGNDIKATQRQSAEMCCDDCQDTLGCVVFVWTNFNGGTCWLKNAKTGKTTLAGAKAGSVPVPSTCRSAETNIDFVANDVTHVNGDQSTCCKACESESKCNAYSWFNNVCYLKSGRGATIKKDGVVSARVVKCSPVEQNVDYVANDLSNVKGEIEDCCAICRNQSGCRAFSWFNGVCYLKSGKQSTIPKAGVISAVVLM